MPDYGATMPPSDHDIELGDRVQDQISGFTGIVSTVGFHITGCTRFGVYPAGDGEETVQRGDEEFFYEPQLETVNGTAFKGVETTDPETIPLELGERVRDDITGYEGTAVVINTFLWNCPQVAVQHDVEDSSDDKPNIRWFDLPRLESVDEGVIGKYQSIVEETTPAATGAVADKSDSSLDKA